ncbi:DNA pilot protein [Apis mellifera associated microvirus 51]|nr:DNA pilot protein [Apis mellifera associated microvirus 51]
MLEQLAGPAVSLAGGLLARDAQREANDRNLQISQLNNKVQKQFAQMGIQWKVEDAKKAGVHPLYALGAQTHSFSPTPVNFQPEDGLAQGVANMGQDITRAIASTQTKEQRAESQLRLASAQLDIQGKALDNQIRAAQLRKLNDGGTTVPSGIGDTNFIPGQGNSNGLVKIKPAERTASQPGRFSQEAGWRPDLSFSRTDTGLVPMVPESLSESLEDDLIGKLFWRFRNQIVPNFSPHAETPPKNMLPGGYDFWFWSKSGQEWRPGKYPPMQTRP